MRTCEGVFYFMAERFGGVYRLDNKLIKYYVTLKKIFSI